jgi:hypothetical protein
MTIISRVWFCDSCRRADRPRTSQAILLYGSKRNAYFVGRARRSAHHLDRGFTPHILKLIKVEGNIVHFKYACGMDGCDVIRVEENSQFMYIIPEENFKEGSISQKSWNSWVMFKDTGYRI